MEETRTYEEVFWENKELKELNESLERVVKRAREIWVQKDKDIEDLKQAIKWRDNIIQNQNEIIRQNNK